MPGKVFGIVIVKFGSVDYRTKGGWTLETGGPARTSQFASGKRSGASEEPSASKTGGAIEIMSDTDLESLRKFNGGEVQYITDVGITYSAPNSTIMNGIKLQDGGRGAEVEVEGDEAVRV